MQKIPVGADPAFDRLRPRFDWPIKIFLHLTAKWLPLPPIHISMKTKSFFALMLGLLLVLGACNEKQEPNNNGTVGGHAWVNLGLPSRTLWAACNVGADSPKESGDYYAWGEIRTKARYAEDN